MSKLTLTKTRLLEGVWQGVLTHEGDGNYQPDIQVIHLQEEISGVEIVENPEQKLWTVRIPIPPEKIADGVQTFLILDRKTGEKLDSFTLISGDALSDDIRAEVTLLREELDMLKRAFRRHCLETM
jgi:hypothetical protein